MAIERVVNISKDGDKARRSKIATIREVGGNNILRDSSGFKYIAISGTGAVTSKNLNPTSVLITNTHATLATKFSISAFRTDQTPENVYILHEVVIPIGASVFLDSAMLEVDSLTNHYVIQLAVASGTPTVDISIKL